MLLTFNINRFVVVGRKSNVGYITKFLVNSINSSTDLTTAQWSFNVLPTGTEDITADSTQFSIQKYSAVINPASYSNIFVTFVPEEALYQIFIIKSQISQYMF